MLPKNIPTDLLFVLIILFLLMLPLLFVHTEQANGQNLQRMNIEREDAGTGIPVFTQYPDKAGIVIESSVQGLRFSSNMQGIVEVQEPASGRYVLIIEPFTQIIRVDAENFVQERFRVGNPQARDVLYFSVMPEQRQGDLVSVIFNVEPDDALLFINGQQVETNATVKLPEQGYELRLEREGYRSINEIVNVSPDDILFTYRLEEIDIMPVRIRSNVEGASVIIDGTERGITDSGGFFELFMFPGSYALTVSKTGHLTQNRTLEVSERGTNQFQVELRRNAGDLVLQTEPGDARIMLNRQEFTGEGRIELAPGRYRLEIDMQNYEPYIETLEINLNETLHRNIELVRHVGSLQFIISPSSANVELIDASDEIVHAWSGMKMLRKLNTGHYTLKANADRHLSEEQQIRISKDETLEIHLELEEGEEWERDTNTEIVDVTNPATGRTWMDRNLGASQVANSPTDAMAFGDLYQWGRAADGHEKRNSITTSTLSNSEQPGHGDFILASNLPFDWRSSPNNGLWQGTNGINNPCPAGYRLPTEAEWGAEIQSWNSNKLAQAYSSPLKLPFTGQRVQSGSIVDSFEGYYWTSSGKDLYNTRILYLNSSREVVFLYRSLRSYGHAVRCIKN